MSSLTLIKIEKYKTLKLGSVLENFSLKGIDANNYDVRRFSIDDFSTRKILVIIFISNSSKQSRAYDSRLIAMQSVFLDKGIQIIAINPNNEDVSPHDKLYQMSIRASKSSFNFPYLKDNKHQSITRYFDAICTPEVFILDKNRELRYRGRIDDNWNDSKAVKKNYVVKALNSLLIHKEVEIPETKPSGDAIKWNY